MKYLATILFACIFSVAAFAQPGSGNARDNGKLANIFKIGEHEKQYEQLITDNQAQLLNVCNNDMEQAFRIWMGMIVSMEEYAETVDYDINAVRFWVHVFWNKDGSINKIGYHLRPNSRQVDDVQFRAFLDSFAGQYKLPVRADDGFSHYTTVAFPTTYMLSEDEK